MKPSIIDLYWELLQKPSTCETTDHMNVLWNKMTSIEQERADHYRYGQTSRFNQTLWPWRLRGEHDFWCLVTADDKYVSDACWEGSTSDMLDMVDALRNKRNYSSKRCAVEWHLELNRPECCLYSPRNSQGTPAIIDEDRALALAFIIESSVAT